MGNVNVRARVSSETISTAEGAGAKWIFITGFHDPWQNEGSIDLPDDCEENPDHDRVLPTVVPQRKSNRRNKARDRAQIRAEIQKPGRNADQKRVGNMHEIQHDRNHDRDDGTVRVLAAQCREVRTPFARWSRIDYFVAKIASRRV